MIRALALSVLVLVVVGAALLFLRDSSPPGPVAPEPEEVPRRAETPADPEVVPAAGTHPLVGRALDAEGDPVPDATVHLAAISAGMPVVEAVQSDPEGGFRFDGVIPGAYVLSALSPSAGEGHLPYVTVPSPEPVTVRLAGSAAFVSGTVRDENGEAVARAKVTAYFASGATEVLGHLDVAVDRGLFALRAGTTTDAKGRFRVGPVPVGSCVVGADGGASGHGSSKAIAPAEDVEIRLVRMPSLHGTVTVRGDERPEFVRVVLEPGGRMVDVEPGPGPKPFELLWLQPGEVRVTARARGFRVARSEPVTLRNGERAGPVDVVLQPGTLLHGRVTDADGNAVVGARIRPGRRTREHSRRVSTLRGPGAPVTTDERGEYAIRLEPGTWEVVADAEGYLSPRGESNEDGEIEIGEEPVRRDFELTATTWVTGVVRDSAGQPVGGLRVQLSAGWQQIRAGQLQPGYGLGTRTTVTDVQGRFRFVHVKRDEPAKLRAETFGGPFERDLEFTAGENRIHLELTLDPPRPAPPTPSGTVRGRVVDEDGQAVSGVLVRSSMGDLGVTGTGGRFVLTTVPVGEQVFRYAALGYAVGMTDGIFIFPREQQLDDFVMRREGLVVTGTVTDTSGAPVEGAEVSVRFEPTEPGFHFDLRYRTFTGRKGGYRINGPAIPGADVHVRITKEGYHAAGDRRKVQGGTTIDLAMSAGCRIRGTLTFTGKTPREVYVAAIGMVDGVHNTHEPRVTWDTGKGVYVTGLFPRGRRRIRISAPGYAPVLTGEYDLVPGRELVLPEITMTPGGTVAGTVRNAAGRPVSGARLTIRIPERSTAGEADEAGRFRIEHLPPGRWKLQANHPQVHRVKTVPVTVEDGAVTTVDVQLPE